MCVGGEHCLIWISANVEGFQGILVLMLAIQLQWKGFKLSLRLPLKILGSLHPTDRAIHIIWVLLTSSWASNVPVLNHSLPGGRLTNPDIAADAREELEDSEMAGTSTDMSIFQNPFMGAQSCSQTPSIWVMVAENTQHHHHHRCWCSTALSLCWLLMLHLEREGQTGTGFFHPRLLLCSLYSIGLNCQAVLKGLELVFHLDASCQYKSINAEAQKNRLQPMTSICFVYWELKFLGGFFSVGMQNFFSVYFPCRL